MRFFAYSFRWSGRRRVSLRTGPPELLETRCLLAASSLVSVHSVQVTETDSGLVNAVVKVSLDKASAAPVSVNYSTRDYSAAAGADYQSASGIVMIPPGQLAAYFSVAIVGDSLYEATESFRIVLSAPVNADLKTKVGVVTIANDDPPPIVSISHKRVIEGRSEQSFAVLSLNEISGLPVEVSYEMSDITTHGISDFVALAERLIIPAGQLSVTIPIITIDDVYDEPNEAFRVTLSDPVGAITGQSVGIVTIDDPDGTQLPLFELSDLGYLGAFRVPEGSVGSASFEFGGNAITFNPASNSLFIASNTNDGLHVAEIAVPTTLVSNGFVPAMTEATVLQPFTDLGKLLTTNSAGVKATSILSYEDLNLGGLLVADGGLTGAMYMGYDDAEPERSTHSHFRTSSLDLSSLTASQFTGLQDVRQSETSISGRLRGGYMAAVPEQWRALIGADFVTGASGLNRIQFSSAGPALFGLNAVDLPGSSGDPLVYYPEGHELQWSTANSSDPLPIFNGTSKVEGVAFVPGTRSVIFIGSNGLAEIGYGVGSLFNDTARPYSGFHSKNGVYQYQIWAYDLEDFMAVRNGMKAAWSLQPTSVVNFDLPTPEPSRFIGGTAYDPSTGRLYVSQKLAGPSQTPVIHVYQLGRAVSGVSADAAMTEKSGSSAEVGTETVPETASQSFHSFSSLRGRPMPIISASPATAVSSTSTSADSRVLTSASFGQNLATTNWSPSYQRLPPILIDDASGANLMHSSEAAWVERSDLTRVNTAFSSSTLQAVFVPASSTAAAKSARWQNGIPQTIGHPASDVSSLRNPDAHHTPFDSEFTIVDSLFEFTEPSFFSL